MEIIEQATKKTRQQKKLEIEDRRRKVAQLYLACVTQEEIARRFGVHQSLISLDLKAIRKQYRAERHELIDREAAVQDSLEMECALRYQTDKQGEWIDRRLKIQERRAKLLGLDAPSRSEGTGEGGAFKVYLFAPEGDDASVGPD